jgi:tubulin alpha
MYRGSFPPKDLGQRLFAGVKEALPCADWSPCGLKCGISAPTVLRGGFSSGSCREGGGVDESGILARAPIDVCILTNGSCVNNLFRRSASGFDELFEKKAMLRQYLDEGMEEGEFTEARDALASLIQDYKDVSEHEHDGEAEGDGEGEY